MTDTTTASGGDVATRRVVRRRRGLPGTRAVVGALLVVAAAVGTLVTYLEATSPPSQGWLVASRAIARGDVLRAEDLDVVLADLPPAQAATVLRAAQHAEVIGTTAGVPIVAGAFLLGSMVQVAERFEGELLSFSLATERALAGQLVEGMDVDVLATYGGGPEAETAYVVRRVRVVRAAGTAGALGGGQVVVTLLLPDPPAVQRVAHALGGAQVWLVRSGSGADLPPPFSYGRRGVQ